MILAGAALQGLAIDITGEIDQGEVAFGGGAALYRLELGHPLPQAADLLVDLPILKFGDLLFHFQAGIIAELRLGHDLDLRLEAVGFVLGLDLLEIDLGLVHGLDAGLFDSCRVPAGEGVFKGVGVDRLDAEMRDEHRPRHLARPESRHLYVLRQLLNGHVDL